MSVPFDLEFRAGTIDRDVITEVIEQDAYHLRRLALPDDAVILDIGAHIGAFAVFAAASFPQARVLAFELDDGNADLLERNAARWPRIETFRRAVTGDVRPVGYRRNPINTGGHHVQWAADGETRPLPPTITLAEIRSRHGLARIDLLKLDCEGAEHTILRAPGALDGVHRIAAEYHNFFGETGAVLSAFLADAGFAGEREVVNEHCGMMFACKP